MNIKDASNAIKSLYKKPNSFFESDTDANFAWEKAIHNFDRALEAENNLNTLELCVLEDSNWEISVNERLKLLKKAKILGASSNEFLIDYFGYLAAHLDPGSEKKAASKSLQVLLDNK